MARILNPSPPSAEQTSVAELESKMREELAIAGDRTRTLPDRMKSWAVYVDLHKQRSPEEVERMEREKGLRK